MHDYDKTIRFNIRHFRLAQGLTQEALAEKSGLSISYVSRIEAGKRTTSLESLYSISEALNVSINDLVYPVKETWNVSPDIQNELIIFIALAINRFFSQIK